MITLVATLSLLFSSLVFWASMEGLVFYSRWMEPFRTRLCSYVTLLAAVSLGGVLCSLAVLINTFAGY